ncbi:kynurenine--oxoglutarate transaminase 3-like isoform X3 [Halichondria panicea]|uniref:kynurenine--oxoglutarate transaminase 3-like isoform X3 n=1 Tax=Halichondria panicea TaxID=6063 RepID=UPI00312B7E32
MAKQNGATVKYVPLRPRGKYPGMSKDWAVDIQELEAAVSKNTKMLVINTPNNPFGKVCIKVIMVWIRAYRLLLV